MKYLVILSFAAGLAVLAVILRKQRPAAPSLARDFGLMHAIARLEARQVRSMGLSRPRLAA